MANPTPRHFDTILSPIITEKATLLSEHNKVVFRVAEQGKGARRRIQHAPVVHPFPALIEHLECAPPVLLRRRQVTRANCHPSCDHPAPRQIDQCSLVHAAFGQLGLAGFDLLREHQFDTRLAHGFKHSPIKPSGKVAAGRVSILLPGG